MSENLVDALAFLIRRDDAASVDVSCETGNGYDGSMGVRISAAFVMLVTSSFGALFPILAKNNPGLRIPPGVFFFSKYFGSGVIVATGFIHLLTPANEALTNPCLTGVITEYPWAQGIALMAVFTLFFVELLAMRFATFSTLSAEIEEESNSNIKMTTSSASTSVIKLTLEPEHQHSHGQSQSAAIEPHLSHVPDHQDTPDPENQGSHAESYAAQLTSLFILEFGVIFHSIFIGLTLAVSGSEFETLYVVLVFHQMFEGLGLGARLATMPWPASKRWTPYIMAQSYGLSTPIAIAIGLGVRNTYSSEGAITLVVNGIFDSVSAGILLYTGLVELMAHEFLFSHSLRDANTSTVFLAFAWMVLGAALMALLGKWA